MMPHDDRDSDTVVSPSGKVFSLAPASLPIAEQAQRNHEVTRAYLADVLETAVKSGPPELAAILVGKAISDVVRTLPVPWLREFAYAGIIRRAEEIADESVQALLDATDGQAPRDDA